MFNSSSTLNIVTQYSDDSDDDTSSNTPSRHSTTTTSIRKISTNPLPTRPKVKPAKRGFRPCKFKVGTVVTSLAVGELQPLQEGQKRR